MMMMKSVIWWRKPEYPEETTDLRQVTDETFHTYGLCPVRGLNLGRSSDVKQSELRRDDRDEALRRDDGDEALRRDDGDEALRRDDGDEALRRDDGDEALRRDDGVVMAEDLLTIVNW